MFVTKKSGSSALTTEQVHALVAQAQAGDMRALQEVLKDFRGPLRSYFLYYVRNTDVADDLWQEVCLRVITHVHRYTPKRPFGAWLHTIGRNLCVNYLRTKKHTMLSLTESMEEQTPCAPAHVEGSPALREYLHNALAQLTTKQRLIFLMYEMDNLSYENIAQAMHLPIGTVKSSLFRSRAILCHYLVLTCPDILQELQLVNTRPTPKRLVRKRLHP